MKIFDAHCDVLFSYGMRREKDFKHDSQLHITFEQLKRRKEVYNVLLYMFQKQWHMKTDLKYHCKW